MNARPIAPTLLLSLFLFLFLFLAIASSEVRADDLGKMLDDHDAAIARLEREVEAYRRRIEESDAYEGDERIARDLHRRINEYNDRIVRATDFGEARRLREERDRLVIARDEHHEYMLWARENLVGNETPETLARRLSDKEKILATFRAHRRDLLWGQPAARAFRKGLDDRKRRIEEEFRDVLFEIDEADGEVALGSESMVRSAGHEGQAGFDTGLGLVVKGTGKGQAILSHETGGDHVDLLFAVSVTADQVLDLLDVKADDNPTGKPEDAPWISGLSAKIKAGIAIRMKARTKYRYDLTRPTDALALLGKMHHVLSPAQAARLFSTLVSDETLDALGPAGASREERLAAIARHLASHKPSNPLRAVANAGSDRIISPSMSLLAEKVLEGLGDVAKVELTPWAAATISTAIAEIEGPNKTRRKSLQVVSEAGASVETKVACPILGAELAAAKGLSFSGFERRTLADGTVLRAKVDAYTFETQGGASFENPLKNVPASAAGKAGNAHAVIIKEFRDEAGEVRGMEVAIRRIESSTAEASAGIQVGDLGVKNSVRETNSQVVIDTFTLSDPSALALMKEWAKENFGALGNNDIDTATGKFEKKMGSTSYDKVLISRTAMDLRIDSVEKKKAFFLIHVSTEVESSGVKRSEVLWGGGQKIGGDDIEDGSDDADGVL